MEREDVKENSRGRMDSLKKLGEYKIFMMRIEKKMYKEGNGAFYLKLRGLNISLGYQERNGGSNEIFKNSPKI